MKKSCKLVHCNILQYLCRVKKSSLMKLTDKEKELIEAIRNYLKSKHNPSLNLEYYARILFEEVMEGQK